MGEHRLNNLAIVEEVRLTFMYGAKNPVVNEFAAHKGWRLQFVLK